MSSSFHSCPLTQPVVRIVLLALAIATSLVAAAANTPVAPALPAHIVAQYWTDVAGRAAFDAARAAFDDHHGRAADPSQVMPFGGATAVWYRVELPQVSAPAQAVFTVPTPGIDDVELFHPDGVGGWRSQRAGDAVPVDDWPLRFLYPAFSITLQPAETQPAYLRIRNNHPVRIALQLKAPGTFMQISKVWHLALGGYVGFMVLVVLLSVANALSWRDPIHLYYAVHVVLVGMSVLSLSGLAGEYLWPAYARWNDTASILIPAVSVGWAALFVRELVVERGGWVISWSLLALAAYSFVMGLAFLLFGREAFYRAPGVYAIPVMVAILAALTWYARRRPEVGLWVLGGMAVLVGGALLALSLNVGALPLAFVPHYGVQIGAALEIPLVLVGLYFRSRERRDNRVRLEALSHTDPLTGVANHRVLVDRLEHLLGRARRDRLLGTVLRVHVANLESIRDRYGREAAEAALVHAAECVACEAAEGDTVARENGDDLVLVLEGQVTRKHASNAARNIVAHGLQFSDQLPAGVTLVLRVGGANAPLPQVNSAALLELLGRLIDDLRHDSQRRAIRFVELASPPGHAHAAQPATIK